MKDNDIELFFTGDSRTPVTQIIIVLEPGTEFHLYLRTEGFILAPQRFLQHTFSSVVLLAILENGRSSSR